MTYIKRRRNYLEFTHIIHMQAEFLKSAARSKLSLLFHDHIENDIIGIITILSILILYCYMNWLTLHRWGWVWATGNVRCLFGRHKACLFWTNSNHGRKHRFSLQKIVIVVVINERRQSLVNDDNPKNHFYRKE